MKKMNNRFTVLALAAVTLLTTVSVGAASVYRNVTAKQDTSMKVQVNGTTVSLKDGDDTNYPLVLDDDIYLPAEEMAEALGYDITVKDNTLSMTTKKATTTTTTTTATTGDIGAEKAKEIALQHAGLSASQVTFIKAERDYDDGQLVYDVEFYTGNKEYDYEILASNSSIWSYDYDAEGSYTPSAGTNYITSDKAKEIALADAGLSASEVYAKVEFDYDDGRAEYEVEMKHGFTEYEYTIDAVSGTILESERDH